MKLETYKDILESFGRCINCRCYFNSINSKRKCILSIGHEWFLPYDDLKNLNKD